MRRPTRDREGNFRLICARDEMNALIGLFWSMATRSAVPSIFSAAAFGAVLSVASVGTSLPPQDSEAAEGVVCFGEIEVVVEAAAFPTQEGAIDDEGGDAGEVAEFEEVGGDFVAPIKFGDFALQIPQARGGALEAFGGAHDAHVVPHEAADFVPIVVDDHEFIDIDGAAAEPPGLRLKIRQCQKKSFHSAPPRRSLRAFQPDAPIY